MKPLYPKVILYHTLPSGEKIPYFIFNRPVKLVYEERRMNGKLFLIGRDGPIYDMLVYERDPIAKAFGGRTLSLSMADGTMRPVKDVWWATFALAAKINATPGGGASISQLAQCFVFRSYKIDVEIYNGWIHSSWGAIPEIPAYEYWKFLTALRRVKGKRGMK